MSKYHAIESPLREFLSLICKQEKEQNSKIFSDCIRDKRYPEDIDSWDISKICEILILLTNRDGRLSEKTIRNYLHFIKNNRNNFSHTTNNTETNSKLDLGMLLIIQSFMEMMVNKFIDRAYKDNCNKSIKLVKAEVDELFVNIAQTAFPDKFDTEGEASVLSEADREFFSNELKTLMHEINLEKEVYTKDAQLDPTHLHKEDFAYLGTQIKDLSKKVAPVKSFKGNLKTLESSINEQLTELKTQLDSTHYELQELGMLLLMPDDQPYTPKTDNYLEQTVFEDEESPDEIILDNGTQLFNLNQDYIDNEEDTIDLWQARYELINLRKRIWKETWSRPSADGLLRKSMIDGFLTNLPHDEDEAYETMGYLLEGVSEKQIHYLDEVCEILKRVV